MKINLTKKQYKRLIDLVALANGVLGILGDSLEKSDYKEKSNKAEELEEYLIGFAKDFGLKKITQKYSEKEILDDDYYLSSIAPILDDYEEFVLFENLANELAKRDFRKDYSKKEIKEMAKENHNYFGKELMEYEKKYWDELEKYGLERLEIKKTKDKVR